nr:hypothetical protein [Tanacetum cinerariifolium]
MIKILMQGTDISKQENQSRLMNEFDKFIAEDGESLTSVYERFSTLINIMDRNEGTPKEISINTKLLNSLQPEWSKYVTLTRQKFVLEKEHFNVLYNYLSQFEPHVKSSEANKAARNHDPLALVAKNGNRNAGRSNKNQATNAGICLVQMIEEYKPNVQRIPTTYSTHGKINVECYNFNGRGHYEKDCPKPRVCYAKYFREHMLVATKDEAGVHLDEE